MEKFFYLLTPLLCIAIHFFMMRGHDRQKHEEPESPADPNKLNGKDHSSHSGCH